MCSYLTTQIFYNFSNRYFGVPGDGRPILIFVVRLILHGLKTLTPNQIAPRGRVCFRLVLWSYDRLAWDEDFSIFSQKNQKMILRILPIKKPFGVYRHPIR